MLEDEAPLLSTPSLTALILRRAEAGPVTLDTLMAALDALFFWLYGLGADDAAYVMAQFPIVREQDERAFGRFRTCEDVLDWLRHVV